MDLSIYYVQLVHMRERHTIVCLQWSECRGWGDVPGGKGVVGERVVGTEVVGEIEVGDELVQIRLRWFER